MLPRRCWWRSPLSTCRSLPVDLRGTADLCLESCMTCWWVGKGHIRWICQLWFEYERFWLLESTVDDHFSLWGVCCSDEHWAGCCHLVRRGRRSSGRILSEVAFGWGG